MRREAENSSLEDKIPAEVSEPTEEQRRYQKRWAQLINQVWHVDPLMCPKCLSPMKIISIIDDEEVIEKILKHTLQHLRSKIMGRRI